MISEKGTSALAAIGCAIAVAAWAPPAKAQPAGSEDERGASAGDVALHSEKRKELMIAGNRHRLTDPPELVDALEDYQAALLYSRKHMPGADASAIHFSIARTLTGLGQFTAARAAFDEARAEAERFGTKGILNKLPGALGDLEAAEADAKAAGPVATPGPDPDPGPPTAPDPAERPGPGDAEEPKAALDPTPDPGVARDDEDPRARRRPGLAIAGVALAGVGLGALGLAGGLAPATLRARERAEAASTREEYDDELERINNLNFAGRTSVVVAASFLSVGAALTAASLIKKPSEAEAPRATAGLMVAPGAAGFTVRVRF